MTDSIKEQTLEPTPAESRELSPATAQAPTSDVLIPHQNITKPHQAHLENPSSTSSTSLASINAKRFTQTILNRETNSSNDSYHTDDSRRSKYSKVLKYVPKRKDPSGHIFPKNYDPNALSPANMKKMKVDKDFILDNYGENSLIYHPAQYGDNLSDDDVSILTPESKGLDAFDDKRKYTIEQKSVSSTDDTSNASSTTKQKQKRIPLNLTDKEHDLDAIEKAEDDTPDGTYVNCELIKQRLRKERFQRELQRSRKDLSLKQRFKRRWDDLSTLVVSHKARNWSIMGLAIFIILFICIFFPIAQKFDLYSKHKPIITVHEILTDYSYPTLGAIRTSLIDPDTPASALTRPNKDGEEWELVFSDEFNAEGRTFYPGMDQFWEAVDLNYAATNDLEWYDPDAATTSKGSLKLQMDSIQQHDLNYRSGMLQSWNKLCFTEGTLEISAKLPGSSHTAGLWPGLWMLGNLARPGYMASTDGVWPYSYDECDAGITANQSSPDGISQLPGQKLNKCVCEGEDHPNRGTGRGAPEIDILEGAHSTDIISGVASQTLQIAPFDIWYLPDYNFVEVYNFTKTNIAHFLGTPYQEMLSTVTTINETWFQNVVNPLHPNETYEDIQTYFQKYSVEYRSKLKKREDNYCRFFVGDEPTSTIYGAALHPDGNIGWRDVPREPMSIILNLGISPSWSMIEWLNIVFPVIFEIDYVRIYQPKGVKQLTCDPPDFPTTQYIQDHLNAYMNPNLTSWEQAGYSFPANKLTSNCKKKH